jgi:hypothetical protein
LWTTRDSKDILQKKGKCAKLLLTVAQVTAFACNASTQPGILKTFLIVMRVKKDSVGNPAKCEAYYQIQSRILKESMDTKKGTFSAEKSAFRAEKLAFLVEKSAFRARKIVFSD